jgi:hypothetical protein
MDISGYFAMLTAELIHSYSICIYQGSESWFVVLSEEHRLRVFENRLFREIFVPKREKVRGD